VWVEDLALTVFDTDDDHRAATLRELGRHQSEYHRWETGGEFRQLFVSLCDAAGGVCAGLLAYTHGVWLEVEFVWVAEPLRRRGHGTRMLAAAEAEAGARGCRRAYLDTAASPAADFFLARGYRPCGELADYRDGRSRYWLHKVLGSASRQAEPGAAPDPAG
jgi:GNAT superfamily N-acetyltransferase